MIDIFSIKNFFKRSDAFLFLIGQCITSFFLIVYLNFIGQTNYFMDIRLEIIYLLKFLVVFFSLLIFKIKTFFNFKFIILILLICNLIDYSIYCYFDERFLLLYVLIAGLTFSFIPLVVGYVIKYLFNKFVQFKLYTNTYIFYYSIILFLLLINIIVPVAISLICFFTDIGAILVVVMLYQFFISKIAIVLLSFIFGILFLPMRFYKKYIIPKILKYIILGVVIHVILHLNVSNDYFQIKRFVSITFSFTLTFVPLYVVYLSDRLCKYLKNKYSR